MAWRNAWGLLAALGLALACASRPPWERSWVEVRTPHFEIWSALSRPGTAELARDLETFRRGVELLAGAALPAPERLHRVYAFDDRGPARSFGWRSRASWLVSSVDGLQLVLREGGGFRGDADDALRHALAHALLRARDGLRAPLWYDEGIALLASTIAVDDDVARIGAPRSDLLGELRDDARIPVRRLLAIEDFDAPGAPRRRVFQAESFAFVHALCFGPRAPRHAPERLLELSALRPPDDDRLASLLGADADALDRELADPARRARGGARTLRSGDVAPGPLRSRPVARSEVLVELGELALLLGRGELARDYLERGLSSTAQAARVRAGLAASLALAGDLEASQERLSQALARAPRDARIERRAGDLSLLRARRARQADERALHAARAREHYGRCLDRDRLEAGAHAGIAAAWLLEGRESDQALAALDKARRLNPGSLELEALRESLLRARGEREAADEIARALRARRHGRAQRRATSPLAIEAAGSSF